ncbi:hypothetical protein RJ035_008262 [Blastomyces gilchristii]
MRGEQDVQNSIPGQLQRNGNARENRGCKWRSARTFAPSLPIGHTFRSCAKPPRQTARLDIAGIKYRPAYTFTAPLNLIQTGDADLFAAHKFLHFDFGPSFTLIGKQQKEEDGAGHTWSSCIGDSEEGKGGKGSLVLAGPLRTGDPRDAGECITRCAASLDPVGGANS